MVRGLCNVASCHGRPLILLVHPFLSLFLFSFVLRPRRAGERKRERELREAAVDHASREGHLSDSPGPGALLSPLLPPLPSLLFLRSRLPPLAWQFLAFPPPHISAQVLGTSFVAFILFSSFFIQAFFIFSCITYFSSPEQEATELAQEAIEAAGSPALFFFSRSPPYVRFTYDYTGAKWRHAHPRQPKCQEVAKRLSCTCKRKRVRARKIKLSLSLFPSAARKIKRTRRPSLPREEKGRKNKEKDTHNEKKKKIFHGRLSGHAPSIHPSIHGNRHGMDSDWPMRELWIEKDGSMSINVPLSHIGSFPHPSHFYFPLCSIFCFVPQMVDRATVFIPYCTVGWISFFPRGVLSCLSGYVDERTTSSRWRGPRSVGLRHPEEARRASGAKHTHTHALLTVSTPFTCRRLENNALPLSSHKLQCASLSLFSTHPSFTWAFSSFRFSHFL